MNAAARSQGAAARQSVTEAYRVQLRLLRDRADASWLDRAAALESASVELGPATFQWIVQQGIADSVVFAGYPSPTPAESVEPSGPEWEEASQLEHPRGKLAQAAERYGRIAQTNGNSEIAARAAQAQIRCLARSGNREAALRAIERYFGNGRLGQPRNAGNRSIAADELMLGLQLLKPEDPRYRPAAERLAARLNDYSGISMPSAQRLFLMDELHSALPEIALPTREAERLALDFVQSEGAVPGERWLERTRLPDVWKLSSGRVVALYRTATVIGAMRELLAIFAGFTGSPAGAVKFDVHPPGKSGGPEEIAAGSALPGWRLSFSLVDTKLLDSAERAQAAASLWIGYLVIASLAFMGVVVGQWMRREARLARLKTDLVAAVSHELRTPLASMRLLIETLLDDPEPERTKVREYLGLMARENQRLSRLIENFLTFSRIERNRQRFVFAPTGVGSVIEKAVAAMGERLQPPSCELGVEVSDGIAPVWADEDALVTVVVNLLDNACKYTPGRKKVFVSASGANGRVTLSVSDNGIGIAPREQRRIFRRFYQVDQRLARETGGCGLGLSIVDFVVRAHGGTVQVESEPGAGSTFRVVLPCVKQETV
jgi:signal transduction histidine kinase